MKDILDSILTKLKDAANHCPSGTGGHDKIWLEDAEKIVKDCLPLTKYYFQPPCKIGDTLYDISDFLDDRNSPEIEECKCKSLTLIGYKGTEPLWYVNGIEFTKSDIGVRLFLSKNEALTAIEALQKFQEQLAIM